MRVVTLLGTRPEIIRLSRILPKLDALLGKDHLVVDTNQNFDHQLSGVFYEELGLRPPDRGLGAKGTFSQQMATIVTGLETILQHKPVDRFLVLGDTNSSLGAIVAKRLGIPVYHMEAGNRCHDPKSPEEVNRRLIDSITDVHLPYTEHARRNLLAEGVPPRRIFVTGNPIKEVMDHYAPFDHQEAEVWERMDLPEGWRQGYGLATLHRQENVDDWNGRLLRILWALDGWGLKKEKPVILSVHPRLRKSLDKATKGQPYKKNWPHIHFAEPFSFKQFIMLERHADLIFTDSGTVQEEACILGVPCVTIRDSTERPETQEVGSNVVCGADPAAIKRAAKVALLCYKGGAWGLPPDYQRTNVSDTVVKVLLGAPPF